MRERFFPFLLVALSQAYFWGGTNFQELSRVRFGIFLLWWASLSAAILNLSNLFMFDISENSFHGNIPWEIGKLSGSLPVSIDKGLPNIETLVLGGNLFHGKIPTSISNLSRLTVLELSINAYTNISWKLRPTSVTRHWRQSAYKDFLSSLKSCKHLSYIQITENPITGVLPKSFALVICLRRLRETYTS